MGLLAAWRRPLRLARRACGRCLGQHHCAAGHAPPDARPPRALRAASPALPCPDRWCCCRCWRARPSTPSSTSRWAGRGAGAGRGQGGRVQEKHQRAAAQPLQDLDAHRHAAQCTRLTCAPTPPPPCNQVAALAPLSALSAVVLIALICGSVVAQNAAAVRQAGPRLLAAIAALHAGALPGDAGGQAGQRIKRGQALPPAPRPASVRAPAAAGRTRSPSPLQAASSVARTLSILLLLPSLPPAPARRLPHCTHAPPPSSPTCHPPQAAFSLATW